MEDKRVNIIGVPISAVNMETAIQSIDELIRTKIYGYICVSNVHTTVMAHNDAAYWKIQSQSLLSLPDGKPLSVIGRRSCPKMDRVTGPDLMREIFKGSTSRDYTHYFYGNTKENLDAFVSQIRKQYPALKIVGYKPSVFRELTEHEGMALCKEINELSPDFCWVALGAPRQEQFCARLTDQIHSLLIGVGGALNILAGLIPEAPKWVKRIGMEWLYRMTQEPARLAKRYAVTNTKFIYYLLTERRKRFEPRR